MLTKYFIVYNVYNILQYCSVLYNMKYLIVMHWFSDESSQSLQSTGSTGCGGWAGAGGGGAAGTAEAHKVTDY